VLTDEPSVPAEYSLTGFSIAAILPAKTKRINSQHQHVLLLVHYFLILTSVPPFGQSCCSKSIFFRGLTNGRRFPAVCLPILIPGLIYYLEMEKHILHIFIINCADWKTNKICNAGICKQRIAPAPERD